MKSRFLSMLITGFALALVLIIAVQVFQNIQDDNGVSPNDQSVTQEELNQTVLPVRFKIVSEQAGELLISGSSEPDAVIAIQDQGENLRQIRANEAGEWATNLDVKPSDTLEIGLLVFAQNGAKVKSEEILYRIPAPKNRLELAEERAPALIIVAVPGGPTRIIQSPFKGVPTAGPLSMGPIDYDERGSVIFSGVSDAEGNVRIYVGDELVGQSPVAVNGRWFSIAVESLPAGNYDIRAELSEPTGNISTISLPFTRLTRSKLGNSDRLIVQYETDSWQIARSLYGGGRQYTAVFAPVKRDAERPEN